MRGVPLFPAEVTPPPLGQEKRALYGNVFAGVALAGVRAQAALALVAVPEQGPVVERVQVTKDAVTSPVAVVRALSWALDLLEPKRWRATLWTNLLMAELSPERRRSLELYPADASNPFRAELTRIAQRIDASGSEIRWARAEEKPHLQRARTLAADAARRIPR